MMSESTTSQRSSHLYSLYNSIDKGNRKAAIGILLISPLVYLYFFEGRSIEALNILLWNCPIILTSMLLLEDYEHLKGLRWLVVARVSSQSQSDGPSQQEQRNMVDKLREKLNGVVVEVLEFEMSATTLDKAEFNRILEMSENDEFDILGISQLDRLTRADHWEAIEFMRTLYQNDVTLCSAEYGPYDWDDPDDFNEITNQIVLSRKHVVNIKNGQNRAYRSRLQDGIWSFGDKAPTMIKLNDVSEDDEDSIYKYSLRQGAEKVANALYDKYIEIESIAEAKRYVNNDILPEGEIKSLSYPQAKKMIGDRTLKGELPSSGEVLTVRDEIAVLSGAV